MHSTWWKSHTFRLTGLDLQAAMNACVVAAAEEGLVSRDGPEVVVTSSLKERPSSSSGGEKLCTRDPSSRFTKLLPLPLSR